MSSPNGLLCQKSCDYPNQGSTSYDMLTGP